MRSIVPDERDHMHPAIPLCPLGYGRREARHRATVRGCPGPHDTATVDVTPIHPAMRVP